MYNYENKELKTKYCTCACHTNMVSHISNAKYVHIYIYIEGEYVEMSVNN